MNILTHHAADGTQVGPELAIYGNAITLAENTARRKPGNVIIIWDANHEPVSAVSFPEEAAV